MTKKLLLFFLLLISIAAKAQKDFIVLKKRGRVINTYFTGVVIDIQLTNRQWMKGYLKKIENDTLAVRPFVIHIVPGIFGLLAADTVYLPVLEISINSIYALPRIKSSFGYIKDGTVFQIGGGGYIALNLINNLIDHQAVISSDNAKQLGIAASVFALGTILHITRKPYLRLGKKYRLEYIALNKSS